MTTAIDLEGLRALVLGRLQRDGSITREDIDEIFSGAVSEQDARIARATEGVVLTARLAAADPQLRNRLPRSVRSAVDNLDRALSAPPVAPAGDREAVAYFGDVPLGGQFTIAAAADRRYRRVNNNEADVFNRRAGGVVIARIEFEQDDPVSLIAAPPAQPAEERAVSVEVLQSAIDLLKTHAPEDDHDEYTATVCALVAALSRARAGSGVK